MNWRTKLSKLSNILALVAILYLLATRIPIWWESYKAEGAMAPSVSVLSTSNESIQLPPNDGKPVVLFFWASWCGPCSVELKRLNAAVESGELDGSRVWAIGVWESPQETFGAARERGYKFQIASDQDGMVAKAFGVKVTPTVVHVSAAGKIEYFTTGLSAMGVLRAKNHLQ